MKKGTIKKAFLAVLLLTASAMVFQLFAETITTSKTVKNKNGKDVFYYIKTDAVKDTVKTGKTKSIIEIKMNDEDRNGKKPAFMGLYTEDLDLAKVRELEYNQTFGILITGVTKGSPADLQGINKDDIIMYIGEVKIIDKDKFLSVIDAHNAGDSVQIKLFSFGKEKTIPFVFGSRNKSQVITINKSDSDNEDFEFGDDIENDDDDEDLNFTDKNFDKKLENAFSGKQTKKSTGFLGGSWVPVYAMINMDDVNGLLTNAGFNKLDENGILLNGIAAKITVGKGYFMGFQTVDYRLDRKIDVIVQDSAAVRRMNYHNWFWTITLDKRYAFTKNFIGSIGLGLGKATQTIELSQTNGNYDWNDVSNGLGDGRNKNVQFERSYLMVNPKAELMYRFLPWLALRAEGSYLYGYAPYSGWKTKLCGDTFETSHAPDTDYQGFAVSVGPWFGF